MEPSGLLYKVASTGQQGNEDGGDLTIFRELLSEKTHARVLISMFKLFLFMNASQFFKPTALTLWGTAVFVR